MGITNLTAMIIASRDDIICTSAGPVDGKYIGWITLGPESRCRPLLNTEPVYESHDAAKAAMEAVVAEIRQKMADDETWKSKPKDTHGEHQEAAGDNHESAGDRRDQ